FAIALDVFVDDVAGDDDFLADIGRAVLFGMILVVHPGVGALHAADALLLGAVLLEDAHLVGVDHGRRADLPAHRTVWGMEPLPVLFHAVRVFAAHERRDYVFDRLEHVALFEFADMTAEHVSS